MRISRENRETLKRFLNQCTDLALTAAIEHENDFRHEPSNTAAKALAHECEAFADVFAALMFLIDERPHSAESALCSAAKLVRLAKGG